MRMLHILRRKLRLLVANRCPPAVEMAGPTRVVAAVLMRAVAEGRRAAARSSCLA